MEDRRPGSGDTQPQYRPSVARTRATAAVEADEDLGRLSTAQLLDGIERMRQERDAVDPGPQLSDPRNPGPRRLRRGFTPALPGGGRDRQAPDRVLRCPLHGRDRRDPVSRQARADPRREAGCSLAASAPVEQVREWKAEHPGAVVVAYVNTDAAVKAEADYCCTSANAVKVVQSIPADREVLFLPDMFLGLYIEHMAGRKLELWLGECHVHAGIRSEDVSRARPRIRTPTSCCTRSAAASASACSPSPRAISRRTGRSCSAPAAWCVTPGTAGRRSIWSAPRSGCCTVSARRHPARRSCRSSADADLRVHEDDHAAEALPRTPRRRVRGHGAGAGGESGPAAIERMMALA